jgi:hypothetical protein
VFDAFLRLKKSMLKIPSPSIYSIVSLNGRGVGRAFESKSRASVHLNGQVGNSNYPIKRNEQFESTICPFKGTLAGRFDKNLFDQTARLNALTIS